jgi:hypothetical protein
VRCLDKPKNQKGVMLIIGAVALVGIFVVVGIVYDFGMWYLTRGELRTIADTAVLTGAKELGAAYLDEFEDASMDTNPVTDPFLEQNSLVVDSSLVNRITPVVQSVVDQHQAGGAQITIASADLQIGTWNERLRQFTADANPPDAVQVTARREEGSNAGALNLIFGPFLGIDTLDVASATSTAALTPLSRIPPSQDVGEGLPLGEIIFPMGVDELFASPMCGDPEAGPPVNPNPCTAAGITELNSSCIIIDPGVTPSNPTCFAWTSYNINDSDPTAKFSNLLDGTDTSPMTRTRHSGDPNENIDPDPPITGAPAYYFHGDAWDQAAAYATRVQNLFAILPDNPLGHVEVLLPVYDSGTAGPQCTAPVPNTRLPISGFISARLRGRGGGFQVKFGCNAVRIGRSGWRETGQNFGTLGSEPVLVQ